MVKNFSSNTKWHCKFLVVFPKVFSNTRNLNLLQLGSPDSFNCIYIVASHLIFSVINLKEILVNFYDYLLYFKKVLYLLYSIYLLVMSTGRESRGTGGGSRPAGRLL